MIFLSHNHADKDFVGDIASFLREKYGQDKVFYDSWSIKPGENIINKMSEGIGEANYFFFFITENSLKSKMVNYEWTAALSKDNIELIPVRAENINVPTILSALNYIDLYSFGLKTTKEIMVSKIENTYGSFEAQAFENLQAFVINEDDKVLKYFIKAKRFLESSCSFLIATNLDETEATFTYGDDGLVYTSYKENLGTFQPPNMREKIIFNGFNVKVERQIHKDDLVPLILEITPKRKDFFIHLHHLNGDKINPKPITPIPISSINQI